MHMQICLNSTTHKCVKINSLKEVRSVSPCECECPRHINTPAQANSGDKKTHRTDQNNVCGRCVLTSGSLSSLSHYPFSHIDKQVLEREQTSVHCCFPSSNERSHHSLSLLSSRSLFQCAASVSPGNETVDTHTHAHCAGTAVQRFQ